MSIYKCCKDSFEVCSYSKCYDSCSKLCSCPGTCRFPCPPVAPATPNGLAAYGSIHTPGLLADIAPAGTIVPYTRSNVLKGVTFQTNSGLIVNRSGDYQISYDLYGTATTANTTLIAEVTANGSVVPGSQVTFQATDADLSVSIARTIIATLPAGSIVTLNLSSQNSFAFDDAQPESSALSVEKLDKIKVLDNS